MRFDGKLKSWNDVRGFGFIEPLQGGQEIFVHIKSLPPGTGRPTVGLALTFEVELGPQGKKRAKSVQFVRSSRLVSTPRHESPARWTVPRRLALPCFFLLYAAVASRWSVSPWVAAAYAAASLLAFFAYALDKSAARHGRRRTSESSLHFLSLACGWPGALLAQQLLRHKSSKTSFVARFWATVIVNVAGFLAIHSPLAKRLLV
ncbi:DUF1294 domain-containing protein [Piscinibacter terrae]|uniref:DUF1294 domain-containing protein n=1 Tax=Piscinibacter terrae TaxID=2496871 RepID=A0A3N7JTJ6_9BURK|nr:cold shock and DUF1294 domain-containing protein [Albitalea terrae]RQP22295.1 DUF1294 domain-containing protein [Albitalea terrae]